MFPLVRNAGLGLCPSAFGVFVFSLNLDAAFVFFRYESFIGHTYFLPSHSLYFNVLMNYLNFNFEFINFSCWFVFFVPCLKVILWVGVIKIRYSPIFSYFEFHILTFLKIWN